MSLIPDGSCVADKRTIDIAELDWPAVICFTGHDELLYLASREDWYAHVDEPGPGDSMNEVLIDSAGRRYALGFDAQDRLSILGCNGRETLDTMIERLQHYAAMNGVCCITKIAAPDIRQAIELVGSIDEQQA